MVPSVEELVRDPGLAASAVVDLIQEAALPSGIETREQLKREFPLADIDGLAAEIPRMVRSQGITPEVFFLLANEYRFANDQERELILNRGAPGVDGRNLGQMMSQYLKWRLNAEETIISPGLSQ